MLTALYIKKARGLDGLPPIFFLKTSAAMAEMIQKVFKNVKRLRKMPVT